MSSFNISKQLNEMDDVAEVKEPKLAIFDAFFVSTMCLIFSFSPSSQIDK